MAIIATRLSISLHANRITVTAFTPLISRQHTYCSSSSPSSRTIAGSMTQLFSSAAAAPTTPTRYILSYDYIPDVLEKRGPYRDGHLNLAKSMVADGTCISGGPTLPPGESVPNGGECTHSLLRFSTACLIQFMNHVLTLSVGMPMKLYSYSHPKTRQKSSLREILMCRMELSRGIKFRSGVCYWEATNNYHRKYAI